MENTHENETAARTPEEKDEGYLPRPVWQVWGARIGLVLFILFVIYQLIAIAGGGL